MATSWKDADRRGVFISYARADGEEFAVALRTRLDKKAPDLGIIWHDRAQLEGGVGWWTQIEAAIERSAFTVLVMTPTAMESKIVRREWRYSRQRGVCVYPIKAAPNLDFNSLPRWMSKMVREDLADEERPGVLRE